jgi:hypothetical protein
MNDRKEKRESSGWVCMNAGQYFDAFNTSNEMFNRDYLINYNSASHLDKAYDVLIF